MAHRKVNFHPDEENPFLPKEITQILPSDPAFTAKESPTDTNYYGTAYRGFQDFTLTYRKDPTFPDMPRYPVHTPPADLVEFALRSEKICRVLGLALPSVLQDKLEGLDKLNTATFDHLEDWRKFFGKEFFRLFFHEIEEDQLAVPEIGSEMHWRSDRYFALQQIGGINPVMLSVVSDWTEANQSMLLYEDDCKTIEDTLTDGVTMEDLVAAKRLFMADYAIASHLNGVVVEPYAEPPAGRANKRAVLHSPSALFWADDNRQLMPLAIQINSGRSLTEADARKLPPDQQRYFFEPEDNPSLPHVWYQPQVLVAPPADTRDDEIPMPWLYARTVVMNTDGIVHEGITHLTYTHLVMETVITSIEHCLPKKHKIYSFLAPHMFGTIAINTAARATLINQEPSNFFTRNTSLSATGVHRAAGLFYNEMWTFEGTALPAALRQRGFGRPDGSDGDDLVSNQLENYFYRDYGFKVWDALEKYCRSTVDSLYADEAALLQDTELAFLFKYLTENEVEGQVGGNMPGVPRFHETKDALVAFLTNFMFTVSSQHAAVNFGQFAFYGFVPNRPLFLATPFPSDPSAVDEKFIINSLPNAAQSLAMIIVGRVLSLPSEHPLMEEQSCGVLGTLVSWLEHKLGLDENPFAAQHAALEKDLKRIEKEMEARNKAFRKTGKWDTYPVYRWLEPKEIASSIAI